MKAEEKAKLEAKRDRLVKKLTDIYKLEKVLRIEINTIDSKLDLYAKRG
jgi:hypothetical protein